MAETKQAANAPAAPKQVTNKQVELERGNPLSVEQLDPGKYYEDILTEQRILVTSVYKENGKHVAFGVYYNRVSGLFQEVELFDNQLRIF